MQSEKEHKKDTETDKNQKYIEDLIEEVEQDFAARAKARIPYERQWELNMNFLHGNQYCGINCRGEIEADGKNFYWQSRGVYNHIAPIIDSRLARFSRIEPLVSVRPKSDDDLDVTAASVAEKLVSAAFKVNDFTSVSKNVTAWSETCGTGFYKLVWNNTGGNKIGEFEGRSVYEGEVNILSVSPFEIYPDNLFAEKLEDCASIIHARALTVNEIKEKYGVTVGGEKISVYGLQKQSVAITEDGKNVLENAAVVVERYERPSTEFPNGRLITVAGGKLLYLGELPYVLGDDKKRAYPFVKQECIPVVGSFYGSSIVERLIPIQRAFNAVKNRKHEFLNRLSMGVMTVEDGSVRALYDSCLFVSNGKLYSLSGAKVSRVCGLPEQIDGCVLGEAAVSQDAYLLPIEKGGEKFVYAYDFISGSESLLTVDCAAVADGGYIVDGGSIFRLDVMGSDCGQSEFISKPLNFDSLQKKTVLGICAFVSSKCNISVSSEYGKNAFSLKKGYNRKKLNLDGNQFTITVTCAGTGFSLSDLRIDYAIRGNYAI